MNIHAWLPASQSRAGQALLDQYNLITHSLFFIVLIGLGVWTLIQIRADRLQEQNNTESTDNSEPEGWIRSALALCRRQPLAIVLMAAYGLAMVHLMTWFYIEIVGWYDSVLDDNLLNNFSLRHYFVKETMRRNDFRFFPLAHQDLHLLSWFTPYVKVWAMVSVAELIAIVALSCQFISKLTHRSPPALLLMTTVLMLFQPSTATAFFQLIYSERVLTLLLIGYATSYLAYQRTKHRSAFLTTLLLATLGLFFKDIAPVMFIIPAAITLALGLTGRMENKPAFNKLTWPKFYGDYKLELWLCGLGVIFILWYVVLSLIPSLYEGQDALRPHEKTFEAGIRYTGLLLFTSIRCWTIFRARHQGNLLDGLNLSAILYSLAVYGFTGFQDGSYLALPVQLVVVLDALYVWSAWLSPYLSARMNDTSMALIGTSACAILIGVDHLQKDNFSSAVHRVSRKQVIWESAYNTTRRRLKSARSNGEEINLIFTDSWFTRRRHLDRLPFNRLIFLDPIKSSYIILDGKGKGEEYMPQTGDYLINIDRGNLRELVHDLDAYEKVYSADKNIKYGNLYRRK